MCGVFEWYALRVSIVDDLCQVYCRYYVHRLTVIFRIKFFKKPGIVYLMYAKFCPSCQSRVPYLMGIDQMRKQRKASVRKFLSVFRNLFRYHLIKMVMVLENVFEKFQHLVRLILVLN